MDLSLRESQESERGWTFRSSDSLDRESREQNDCLQTQLDYYQAYKSQYLAQSRGPKDLALSTNMASSTQKERKAHVWSEDNSRDSVLSFCMGPGD